MMELYVLGGGAVIILLLFAWGKIQIARANAADVKAYTAMETAKSAQVEIAQTNKTAEAVATVKEKLTVEQKEEQVKFESVDGGDRSFMENDTI